MDKSATCPAIACLILVAACGSVAEPGTASTDGGARSTGFGGSRASSAGAAGEYSSVTASGGASNRTAASDATRAGGAAGNAGSLSALTCGAWNIVAKGSVDGVAFSWDLRIGTRGAYLTQVVDAKFGAQESGRYAFIGFEGIAFEARLKMPTDSGASSGAQFCADGAASIEIRDDGSNLVNFKRLGRVSCPGSPVEGSLTLQGGALIGTVDGRQISNRATVFLGSGKYNYLGDPALEIPLDASNATGAVAKFTFIILSGAQGVPSTIYCVDAGTFSRSGEASDASSYTIELTKLSRVAPCNELPSVGTASFCLRDE